MTAAGGRGAFAGGAGGFAGFGGRGGAGLGEDFSRDGFPGTGRSGPADGTDDRLGDRGTGGVTGRDGFGAGFGGAGGTTSLNATLAKLLETGAPGYKWAAATSGSDSAAALELGTGGVPVMALGGFSGSDPTPTLAAFKQMVAAHEVHYFIGGGAAGGGLAGGLAGRGGGGTDAAQVEAWVESNFTAKTVGGETVYDLTTPASGS